MTESEKDQRHTAVTPTKEAYINTIWVILSRFRLIYLIDPSCLGMTVTEEEQRHFAVMPTKEASIEQCEKSEVGCSA